MNTDMILEPYKERIKILEEIVKECYYFMDISCIDTNIFGKISSRDCYCFNIDCKECCLCKDIYIYREKYGK